MTASQHGNNIKLPEQFFLSESDSTERLLESTGHVVLRPGGVPQHLIEHENERGGFESDVDVTDSLTSVLGRLAETEFEVAKMRAAIGLIASQIIEFASAHAYDDGGRKSSACFE